MFANRHDAKTFFIPRSHVPNMKELLWDQFGTNAESWWPHLWNPSGKHGPNDQLFAATIPYV